MFPTIAADPISLEASRLLSRKDGAPDPEAIQQLIDRITAKILECEAVITSIHGQLAWREASDHKWALAARTALRGYHKQKHALNKSLKAARDGMLTVQRALKEKARTERLKLEADTALKMRALGLREKAAAKALAREVEAEADRDEQRQFAICFRRACREIVGEVTFQAIVTKANEMIAARTASGVSKSA